ncbi:hypothetical protein [Aeromonas veronii]|uniref:hypothetical protein n=1 Tax=Aeromonas veronii TaxID=654 RepID=UPI003B9FDBBB
MKRTIIGVVLVLCTHNGWANRFSPNLSADTCKFHAALAKEFMSMRLDGKTKAEVLADVRKRMAGWDFNGFPKEYGDVNEKLVEVVFNSPQLQDVTERELSLTLVEESILDYCLGKEPADESQPRQSETETFHQSDGPDRLSDKYPDGISYADSYDAEYCFGIAHQASYLMNLRLFFNKTRAELLSDTRQTLDWEAEVGDSSYTMDRLISIRLIHEAYEEPLPSTDESKSKLVGQFKSSVMKRCLGR